MLATYATVARRAAAITALVAAILVGISAALVGTKGLIGALVGVAIVAVFFGISILVVGRAAKISPPAMMIAALATFIVKIVLLMVVVSTLKGTTAFSTRTLGFVAVGCILVWSFAQVAVAIRVRLPYVEPVPGPASEAADGKR
jgi:ATP synthase protein I